MIKLSFHQRLMLQAANACLVTGTKRLIEQADYARAEMLVANAADPYDHEEFLAWERIFVLSLHRLFGGELAAIVSQVVCESGESPSWVINHLCKDVK